METYILNLIKQNKPKELTRGSSLKFIRTMFKLLVESKPSWLDDGTCHLSLICQGMKYTSLKKNKIEAFEEIIETIGGLQ